MATNRGQPLALNGQTPAGKAFGNIAARLLGEEVPFMSLAKEGLFGRIRRLFGSEAQGGEL